MSSAPPVTLVFLRQALRVDDNPPLWHAAQRGAVVPVHLYTPGTRGAASQVWLHHALADLGASLRRLGSPLVLRVTDDPLAELGRLVAATGATALYYDQRVEPEGVALEAGMERAFGGRLDLRGWHANLLTAPGVVRTGADEPFRVFTPYWKAACRQLGAQRLVPAPSVLQPPPAPVPGVPLDALALLPARPWGAAIAAQWEMTEAGAQRRWAAFRAEGLPGYAERRDLPDVDGTSRLSPWLHFGQVSPRRLWNDTLAAPPGPDVTRFQAELGWREFAHQLLAHYPHTRTEPLNPRFAAFPWADDAATLRRWQRGETGYPIVDAGMRQLWSTGWMHNRVRMIVGSFLVKHLLQPWRAGEAWFRDTLVDADAAQNTLGWQWIAGCGADAAPYFRIFNPTLQGQKFDPDGHYVRRWVPELARVPAAQIHTPGGGLFRPAGYPAPIVDHEQARVRALAALATIKAGG